MVKRSEPVNLGGVWREGHGLSVRSKVLVLSSRLRRTASSLRMQPEEPVVASYGLTKTATLTMLSCSSCRALCAPATSVCSSAMRRS